MEYRQRSASAAASRHRRGQHRQHEHLGLPERVPGVAGPGQTFGRRSAAARPGRWPGADGTARTAPPAAPPDRRRPRRRRAPRTRPDSSRWSAARPSQPVSRAAVSAASTSSWSAPADWSASTRRTRRTWSGASRWPGIQVGADGEPSLVLVEAHLRVGRLRRPATRGRRRRPAAARCCRVRCVRQARDAVAGLALRLQRGPHRIVGPGSSASRAAARWPSSSDWSAIRCGVSTGSTSYRIASTARWLKRDQPGAADPHRLAGRVTVHSTSRRRVPARKSRVRSWREHRPVPHVEGLVVDQQPDQLAVGRVDHALAGLGKPVARLGDRSAGATRRTSSGSVPARSLGSPSSRLPRTPMWPLDSANSDSVRASRSGSELRLPQLATARPGTRLAPLTGRLRARSASVLDGRRRSSARPPTGVGPTVRPGGGRGQLPGA